MCYKDLSHAPDGTGSASTRRHIVEAFGANTRYLVNIIDRVVHLAFTILMTGETVKNGNIILKKGCNLDNQEIIIFAIPGESNFPRLEESRLKVSLYRSRCTWIMALKAKCSKQLLWVLLP